MRNVLIQTNSSTCGASVLPSRSFKFAKFSRSSGCSLAARGFQIQLAWRNQQVATSLRIRAFSPGYRGLSRVLQNAPSCMPDVLHSISPAFVASQALHVLKPSEGFSAWGAKNLSQSNINWHRSAKL